MTRTARLRLAVSLAAAIASTTAFHRAVADDQGPKSAEPPPSTQSEVQPGKETPAGPAKRNTYPFRGVIAKIDEANRTIALEGKQNRRLIRVLKTTRVEKLGRPAMFEDLRPGEAVGGTLRRSPAGEEEALLVRVGNRGNRPTDEAPEAARPEEP